MDDDVKPWLLNGFPIDETLLEGLAGFVYVIHNLDSSRRYVGKKLLKFKRTKIIKGKKKRFLVDSDWKTYYGSNAELLADVEKLGTHRFMREIVHLCKTKTELTYLELREQMDRRVLERDDYYNGWVIARVREKLLRKL